LSRVLVEVEPPTVEARRLWISALELASAFDAGERWTLVGGLMVQLHAFEHLSASRLTVDVDFLGDSRRRPAMTKLMAETLVNRGGEMTMPPVGDTSLGYRFEIDGTMVEILGSEGVRRDPKTLGKHTTFQVPGGAQALARTEVVLVSLEGGDPVEMRRPSLLGAILIKARVVARRRDKFQSDRQDLIRLLSFVENPRALAGELRKSERRWLRTVGPLLTFHDGALADLFPRENLIAAEQAYQLLVG
jgi:hypothetical protein